MNHPLAARSLPKNRSGLVRIDLEQLGVITSLPTLSTRRKSVVQPFGPVKKPTIGISWFASKESMSVYAVTPNRFPIAFAFA
jgi:hypothetical protein